MLRLGQVGRPTVGDREVLLGVHAAGVDRGVWHLVTGLPYCGAPGGVRDAAAQTPCRAGRSPGGRGGRRGRDDPRVAKRCSASPGVPSPSARGPGRASSRQALEPRLCPGRGGTRIRPDRPAGGPRPRTRAGRPAGPGHRRLGRRRHVRRADRQGVRRGVTGVCSTAKADIVGPSARTGSSTTPATTSPTASTAMK